MVVVGLPNMHVSGYCERDFKKKKCLSTSVVHKFFCHYSMSIMYIKCALMVVIQQYETNQTVGGTHGHVSVLIDLVCYFFNFTFMLISCISESI